MSIEQRITELEHAAGVRLPADFRAFLFQHREDPNGSERLVSSNPDYWGVHSIFEIGDGEDYLQLDGVYRLVADAMPPGMVPFADDSGGNLYLIDCAAQVGAVYWWNHERDVGQHHVDHVADSFTKFMELLSPAPD